MIDDILIVGDSHQQDSGKGIYWKNRELAKLITDAHFSGTNTFSFDGIRYSLESVTKYVRYSTEKNKWVESATGLFNIFKRMRLKREIRAVEDKLNDYS